MTCAEFQKVLPYIIETGGNEEEERHRQECPVCSDLVADLNFIAGQAKLLAPLEEPHARVWQGIRASLEREGLIKPVRARRRGLRPVGALSFPGLAAAVAALLVVFGIYLYQREAVQTNATGENEAMMGRARVALESVGSELEDQQLLSHLEQTRPAALATYEANLQQVNASIADALKHISNNPTDKATRQYLIQAYQQKAMVYDLAMRPLR